MSISNTPPRGNMLGVDGTDLLTALMISILRESVLDGKMVDLLLQCFDPVQASAMGLNVAALHFGLLAAVSMTVSPTLRRLVSYWQFHC